jgi:hypothetical protein
MSYQANITTIA